MVNKRQQMKLRHRENRLLVQLHNKEQDLIFDLYEQWEKARNVHGNKALLEEIERTVIAFDQDTRTLERLLKVEGYEV